MTPEMRRRLAVHEAAHAVAAVIVGAPVAWVDLDWRPGVAGGTLVREVDPHTDAVVALAGYEASGGALQFVGETHDTAAARSLVGDEGMAAATQGARAILAAHRDQVLTVAAALLEAGRLTGDQVVELVRAAPLAGSQAAVVGAGNYGGESGGDPR